MTSAIPSKGARRLTVFCRRLRPSANWMNGFGCASRETGHKRVPLPPERIKGINIEVAQGWRTEITTDLAVTERLVFPRRTDIIAPPGRPARCAMIRDRYQEPGAHFP